MLMLMVEAEDIHWLKLCCKTTPELDLSNVPSEQDDSFDDEETNHGKVTSRSLLSSYFDDYSYFL